MITWAEKIAFVGMTVETVPPDEACYKHHVRVRIPGGACSYGGGDTIEEATVSAAMGMRMDWRSIESKITKREWEKIAHE